MKALFKQKTKTSWKNNETSEKNKTFYHQAPLLSKETKAFLSKIKPKNPLNLPLESSQK
jgi:hypothetical protein